MFSISCVKLRMRRGPLSIFMLATNVPLPGLRTRKPSCSSSLSAMRTVVRLMPKESCSCFSDGRIEPGG